ncbi:MAG: hypothetical protein Nkreftii_000143 [Candidatus Nitrospira kreftii]|uniref:Uncharacterized protein n=1 Tax=Candidatus Nitrospira kreftii TaxID=2652173 RepID=A0A7S8IXT4_9BACT|nr:MAG: hypothetical protein Nkreftii_000143 [Candidatus Nitrospira kreftii]
MRWRRNAKRRVDRMTPDVWFKVNRRLIMKDNETQAWQAWKIAFCVVVIVALFITVAHVVVGI